MSDGQVMIGFVSSRKILNKHVEKLEAWSVAVAVTIVSPTEKTLPGA